MRTITRLKLKVKEKKKIKLITRTSERDFRQVGSRSQKTVCFQNIPNALCKKPTLPLLIENNSVFVGTVG